MMGPLGHDPEGTQNEEGRTQQIDSSGSEIRGVLGAFEIDAEVDLKDLPNLPELDLVQIVDVDIPEPDLGQIVDVPEPALVQVVSSDVPDLPIPAATLPFMPPTPEPLPHPTPAPQPSPFGLPPSSQPSTFNLQPSTPIQPSAFNLQPSWPLPTRDPVSGGEMIVTRLECPSSGVKIEGRFSLGWIGKLTPEQIEFVGSLAMHRGNVQKVAASLGIAYNTARSRLEDIGAALSPAEHRSSDRLAILNRLGNGEINVQEALKQLRGG